MFDSEHDAVVPEDNDKPHRGIYLLPNLLTTAALFCGFFSMVSAIAGKYEQACAALFFAGILDGLDGRVARMTNTQSDFGNEYDSMSDLVSFGMAPAILVYTWVADVTPVIRSLPLSWLVTFFFVACAALRLARFNTQVGKVDSNYFVGLPSPTGAGIVAFFVWTATSYDWDRAIMAWPLLILTTVSALLMVSSLRFFSFKTLNLNGRVPFRYMLAIVVLFILVALEPPLVLWLAGMAYTFGSLFFELRRQLAETKGSVKEASGKK